MGAKVYPYYSLARCQSEVRGVGACQNRDCCIIFYTHVVFPCGFIINDYDFVCLYNQSTYFDNSKMVNWVNLVQKLTKIQGKI